MKKVLALLLMVGLDQGLLFGLPEKDISGASEDKKKKYKHFPINGCTYYCTERLLPINETVCDMLHKPFDVIDQYVENNVKKIEDSNLKFSTFVANQDKFIGKEDLKDLLGILCNNNETFMITYDCPYGFMQMYADYFNNAVGDKVKVFGLAEKNKQREEELKARENKISELSKKYLN